MRIGVGIAAGISGLVLYGALYYWMFSQMFQEFDLVLRLVLLGMLFSGIAFIAGFNLLEGDGAPLFAKALALPLIGAAVLLVGMGTIMQIPEVIPDIFVIGIGYGAYKFYELIDHIFFPG